MRIIIGADIVPTKTNQNIFEAGEMEKIVDADLYSILKDADYRIFNLETPLTDVESPIAKNGPCLIASEKSVFGYKQLGVDFLTLANNHILDQDEQGLFSTVKQLENADIAFAGVGKTLDEASKPYIFELEGKKIGVYLCAEHEFSIASDKKPGANPFDPLESPDHIVALKAKCDYVICLYHGGKEHYRYPSPSLQKTCRKIIEKGADIVVCQHSHCIGCEEKYQSGTIVYGQGNFLFDYSDSEYWKTSVLVSIELPDGKVSYIPLVKDGNGVKLAPKNDAGEILAEMQTRSELIKQDGFIQKNYAEYASKNMTDYLTLADTLTTSFAFRAVNKLLGHKLSERIAKKKKKKYGKILINQYECEAHRELIIAGLNESERDDH